MSATILSIDPIVVQKYKLAQAMSKEFRSRMNWDPETALEWASASFRKLEEALELSRKNGAARHFEVTETVSVPSKNLGKLKGDFSLPRYVCDRRPMIAPVDAFPQSRRGLVRV